MTTTEVLQFAPLVRSVVARVRAPETNRPDMEQEVWLRLCRYAHRFDSDSRNLVISHIRGAVKDFLRQHLIRSGPGGYLDAPRISLDHEDASNVDTDGGLSAADVERIATLALLFKRVRLTKRQAVALRSMYWGDVDYGAPLNARAFTAWYAVQELRVAAGLRRPVRRKV